MQTLLTTAQVAHRLGCNPTTVTRWATTGRIEFAAKLPGTTGAYLFTPAAVLAKLEELQGRAS